MDVQKLIQEQRELFIQARTIEEKKLEEFASNISSVDAEKVFAGTYIPADLSLKAFCPEIYKEEPDPVVYEEQYNKMIEIITPINAVIEKINKDAAELVSQFRQMEV